MPRTIVACVLMATTLSLRSLAADQSPHSITFVNVAPDVRLEVLDWGGSGPPVVLLAGLSDTAHVFDSIAPHLTAQFHVLGITRRGFGASSRPEAGYDSKTLAHDILVTLDQLHLNRVALIGHSIAGGEMTTFATTYSDRVPTLIYLDSAYDFTTHISAGPDQAPTLDDFASIDAYNSYLERTIGVRLPDSEMEAVAVVDVKGRMKPGTVSRTALSGILAGVEAPAFERVLATVMAIYAPVTRRGVFPNYEKLDDDNKQRADQELADLEGRAQKSMRRLKTALPTSRVV